MSFTDAVRKAKRFNRFSLLTGSLFKYGAAQFRHGLSILQI